MTSATLLPAWLRRDGGPPALAIVDAAAPSTRAAARRAQFDEIGEFLDHHELEPSEVNFAVARAHLAGDPIVSDAVTALLRAREQLTDAAMARVAEQRDRSVRPEWIADMAESLAGQFAKCLRLLNATSQSNDRFRAALDTEVTALAHDPLGTVERLVDMTRQALEVAQAMELELGHARQETERLRSNLRRAQRDADRDHLTGLPNRRCFETRLGMLDRARPAAIALCDVDDFKVVNDSHGHGTGDRVLKFVGRLLRTELGDHAVVARYGGEEFVCLFEDCGADEAADQIDRARVGLLSRSLARRNDGRTIGRLTFSAGVANVAHDAREALKLADEALYRAKRGGKNQVVVAS